MRRAIAISDVVISSITLAELEYGVAKSSRPNQNKDASQEFVYPLEIMPFDDMAASAMEKSGFIYKRKK